MVSRFGVALAWALMVLSHGTAAVAGEACSEESIKKAVELLRACDVKIATYVEPETCVKAVTKKFAIRDSSTLARICTPETSGRCLDALLSRLSPAQNDIEGGLLRLATACRDVSPFCAVDFINAHSSFDPAEILNVCALGPRELP